MMIFNYDGLIIFIVIVFLLFILVILEIFILLIIWIIYFMKLFIYSIHLKIPILAHIIIQYI